MDDLEVDGKAAENVSPGMELQQTTDDAFAPKEAEGVGELSAGVLEGFTGVAVDEPGGKGCAVEAQGYGKESPAEGGGIAGAVSVGALDGQDVADAAEDEHEDEQRIRQVVEDWVPEFQVRPRDAHRIGHQTKDERPFPLGLFRAYKAKYRLGRLLINNGIGR